MQVTTAELHYSDPLNCGHLTLHTTDSKSDKEDSEQESHVESTTINTTGEKRKKTAGNMAVHDGKITIILCK